MIDKKVFWYKLFSCFSSNSQLGINDLHFCWYELKVDLIKLYRKLTLRYFFLICSSSKLLEILCALCKPPRIAFFGDCWWPVIGYLRFFYCNRCFNDTVFIHNFRIQEFARIYLYCQLYIQVIVIQFFEKFIWLILDPFAINIIDITLVKFWF